MDKENKSIKFGVVFLPTCRQRGTVIVYVAILIMVLIGFAALAVDMGHLYVARNELQDAADAGALAGAGRLYLADGTAVNDGTAGIPSANQFAYDATTANTSQNQAVEVQWTGGNTGDIERGHWSFATRRFTPSDRIQPPQLWDYTTQQLDDVTTFDPNYDPNNPSYRSSTAFVNAVRVKTRRESIPVVMTFARIFGFPTYPVRAEAIAYLGFAGTLAPGEVDWPLAICLQAIRDQNGAYSCHTAREINSGTGGGGGGHNTAAYTNYTQPCTTTNPANSPRCQGNTDFLIAGNGMGTTNGADVPIYRALYNCWRTNSDTNHDGIPDTPWSVTLPVVDCGDDLMIGNCMPLTGAVTLTILWMETDGGSGQITYPRAMGDWSCPSGWTDSQCFNNPNDSTRSDFVHYFNIKDWQEIYPSAPAFRSIYFMPECAPHELSGRSGGPNTGILARIPVLVAPPRN